jgi:DNA-binding transcriptional MocR family regulator
LKSLGLPARPQDILITDGASQAVFVALATVARASDVVATAALTDHGAIAAAHLLGCNVKGLPTDEFGIIGECFEQLCKVNPIKALIVTPNLNNPTVSLMPMERRVEISRIAQMYGVFIIEDDVYGPLVDGAPPPISALAPELGLYCTSFTKSVMTGLRTGYLAVPRKLFLRAESVLRVATWMATPLVAEIGCRWVLDGTARRLVEGQRKAIAPRYQALRDILGSHLLGSHSNALSAWVSVPEPWTVDRIIAEARRLNIAITAPDPFIVDYDARPNAFRLCIGGGIQIANLQTALRRISELLVQHPVIHDIV